ncbi:MAG: ABC transporter ATP-binding protein [Methylobacter sp.]
MELTFKLACTRGRGDDNFHISTPLVELKTGDILALTGPSGSGKSTILEILGLVLKPEADSHFVWESGDDSLDIVKLWAQNNEQPLAELRANNLGFVLQSGGLVPFLNVRENIALPRLLAGMSKWHEHVDELIEKLGITHLLTKKPHQLSVGERQRTAIACALAQEPSLLLADEPTAALDPARAEIVMKLLIDLVLARQGMAVIVTHDCDLIRRLDLQEMRAVLHPGGKAAVFSHVS